MRRFFRDNALSVVVLALFLVLGVGQATSGWRVFNEEQADHGEPTIGFVTYLTSSHFGEATFENWESEFLQMAAYIVLTVRLRQRGSAESKGFDGPEDVDEDPREHRNDPDAPWPVRKGGIALVVYQRSLSLAFLVLFGLSFLFHAMAGARSFSVEQAAHGAPSVSTWQYLHRAQFWFESLQNWQSELLAVASIVLLSIWLRQHGSPESKPVHAPHRQTGS